MFWCSDVLLTASLETFSRDLMLRKILKEPQEGIWPANERSG